MNDPIADMLIRMKNAGDAHKLIVSLPHSKIKSSILEVLQKAGYIKSFSKKGKKVIKTLEVELSYEKNQPRISDVKRVSKLSSRVYYGMHSIRPVKQGHGTSIFSTPKGILTGAEARKQNVGGELLFEIW